MKATYHIHTEIVDRCLAGDRMAYEELYRLYSRAMYNVSLRITNDKAEAEDVLQEAFVSAFQYLNTFNQTSSFGAWLKRIVVNKSLNNIKRRRLDTIPLDTIPMEKELDTEEAQYDMDFEYDITQVRRAIEQLPDGYRTVFSLYLLEGYDHREIAQILGISESTSKSQYNRSKKKLLEILKQEVVYER